MGIKVGSHKFREFNGLDAAFGADEKDYPSYSAIPDEFKRGSNIYNKAFNGLFFNGGKLEDFGISMKPGTDKAALFATLRALMSSFAPKHEVKEATVAWLLSEYTEPLVEA